MEYDASVSFLKAQKDFNHDFFAIQVNTEATGRDAVESLQMPTRGWLSAL